MQSSFITYQIVSVFQFYKQFVTEAQEIMGQTCQSINQANLQFGQKQALENLNLQKAYAKIKSEHCRNLSDGSSKEYRINQNMVYYGKVNQQNQKEGYGQLRCGQRIFAGTFRNNLPQGEGVLIDEDYFYIGEFSKGKPHGKGQQRRKQFQFIGQFVQGRKVKGSMSHPQFSYQGQFKYNLFEGKGRITYLISNITYQGQFKSGKFNGQGLINFKDKYKYEGQFRQGTYHGKGLMLSQCGQIFQGHFKNGQKNGKGYMKTSDDLELFTHFINVNKQGESTIKFKGEEIDVLWKNNKLVESYQN